VLLLDEIAVRNWCQRVISPALPGTIEHCDLLRSIECGRVWYDAFSDSPMLNSAHVWLLAAERARSARFEHHAAPR
jgi:hypothetical protein